MVKILDPTVSYTWDSFVNFVNSVFMLLCNELNITRAMDTSVSDDN